LAYSNQVVIIDIGWDGLSVPALADWLLMNKAGDGWVRKKRGIQVETPHLAVLIPP
jgi:hypothetical protein